MPAGMSDSVAVGRTVIEDSILSESDGIRVSVRYDIVI